MTYTRRLFVQLVAIMLVLGSTTTGVAAQSSDSEPVSVVLGQEIICGIDLSWGAGGFGTWYRNGTTWSHQPPPGPGPLPPVSSPPGIIIVADIDPMPAGGCDVNVTFSGLNGSGGSIPAIPDHFLANSTVTNANVDPSGWTHDDVTASQFHITFVLNSVPDNLPAGRYEGQVTVTVTNAA